MNDERDERPIENLLRRYANKRREEAGAPLDVHPATRRLLQNEVRQQYRPSATSGSVAGLFARLWARWSYAAAVVAVVGMAAVFFLPAKKDPAQFAAQEPEAVTRELATNSTREEAASARYAREPEKPLTPGERSGGDSIVPAESRSRTLLADAPSADGNANRTAPATPQAGVDLGHRLETVRRNEGNVSGGSGGARPGDGLTASQPASASPARREFDDFAKSSPAAAAPGKAATLAEAKNQAVTPSTSLALGKAETAKTKGTKDAETTLAFTRTSTLTAAASSPALGLTASLAAPATDGGPPPISQNYVNVGAPTAAAKAFNAPAAASVLANFRVEQAGRQLRVVDGDGSTYVGVPASAVTGRGAASGAVDGRALGRGVDAQGIAASPAPEQYRFAVQGTNRTLQQPVSFEWNFINLTNAFTRRADTLSGNGSNAPVNPWENSIINGEVKVNNGPALPISAAPIKR